MRNTTYEGIEQIIEKYKAAGYFKQAACAVFDKDCILYTCGFGGADEKSLFDLASLTKIFTTTIILKLVETEKVKLGDTIDIYLSEPSWDERKFPNVQKAFSQITVYQLLTHTGGLEAWYPFYADGREFYEILEKLISFPLKQGEVLYSDIDYMLLGKIAENILDTALYEAMEIYVRQPLAIEALMYRPLDKQIKGNIIPSSYDNKIEEGMCEKRGMTFDSFRPHDKIILGEANDGNCQYYFNGISGHAGLFSNAEGVARLGMFYLGEWEKGSVFAKAQKALEGTRGLGFDTGLIYPKGCGHTGFTGTSLYLSGENNIGAVVLTNRLMGEVNQKTPDLTQFRHEFAQTVLKCAIAEKAAVAEGKLRKGKVSDAMAIARIYNQGLLSAYRHILPKSYLDSLSMEDAKALWEKNLRRNDYRCIVMEEDGGVVGFIGMKPDEEYENCMMLAALYVDEAYKGRSIGTRLIEEAKYQAKLLGKESVSIVVVLKNERAKSLYEHLGAEFDKESSYDFGGNIEKCGKYLWKF